MNSAIDHGYAPTGMNLRCIACGKAELDCCDGKGTPLPEAVKMLFQIKRAAEHQRRFGSDVIAGWRGALVAIEGDAEEWLIANGYMESAA